MQNSLFDLENRYASLSKTGDPLERLNAIIDWEMFRPILERMDVKARKSKAGRKPTCRIRRTLPRESVSATIARSRGIERCRRCSR